MGGGEGAAVAATAGLFTSLRPERGGRGEMEGGGTNATGNGRESGDGEADHTGSHLSPIGGTLERLFALRSGSKYVPHGNWVELCSN